MSNDQAAGNALPKLILAEVARLKSDYEHARRTLEQAVSDLRNLVTSRPALVAGEWGVQVAEPNAEPSVARVNVTFDHLSALLTFEDELSAVPGVENITVAGAKERQASLLVFFRPVGRPQASRVLGPTVVCVECGAILVRGSEQLSHGLCPECTAGFLKTHGGADPSGV